MKKKFLLALLSFVSALCCAFGLAACDNGGGNDDGHHYSDGWKYSPTHHWHQCSDEDCEEPQKDRGAHDDSTGDGKCDVCNILIPSQGLEFGIYTDIYNPEYLEAVAITGLGSCTDTDIILPSTNEDGEPVIAIEIDAFTNSEITSVVIPDTVEVIGAEAFYGCAALENITFTGNNLKIIEGTFRGCTSLKSLVIPEGVTYIGPNAFMECEFESLSLPSTLTSVGDSAFSYMPNKEIFTEYENGLYLGNAQNPYVVLVETKTTPEGTFTVHEDTKIIASGVFSGSSKLESVVMSANVVFIGGYAFSSCPLANIQYGGTLAQWEAIEKPNFRPRQGGDMVVTCTDDIRVYPMT